MKKVLSGLFILGVVVAWMGPIGIQKVLDETRVVVTDYDHVFLADKVGDPPMSVTFQVESGDGVKRPFCIDEWSGGYHQWERPWNTAVINAAKLGDLIRVYHYTESYCLFGRTLWQFHQDTYYPQDFSLGRQLYPEPKWPFALDNPKSAYRPLRGA